MQDFAGSTAVHLIGATGRVRGAAAARPAEGEVRGRRQAAADPGAQHAPVRPGRADPLAGLVRVQPGLDPQRPGRALPGDPDHHEPGRRRRRARRGPHGPTADREHRHRHGRQRRDRGAGRDHRSVGLRRALGRADHRRRGRSDRRRRRVRHRQGHRRPGGRAVRARPGRYLGNDLVRHLHGAAAGPVQRLRRSRRRSRVLGQVHPADRPGGRLLDRVHVRLRR